jgi:hypothetical protein
MPRWIKSVASPPSSRIPVILQRFTLDREHGRTARRDRGGGVVLRRIDVAGRPTHVGAERCQRFDQHRGLNRHVQRASDPCAAQRLFRAILIARRHQSRHFGFGDGDFLAAPFGKPDVLDGAIGGRGFGRRGSGHGGPWLLGMDLARVQST